MRKINVMKEAVKLAKTFTGHWAARMKEALKIVWRKVRFFAKLTFIQADHRTNRREVYYKGTLLGRIKYEYGSRGWVIVGRWSVGKVHATVEEAAVELAQLNQYLIRYKQLMEQDNPQHPLLVSLNRERKVLADI